jgi:C-terminal processing protease CtpA/Prc
MKKCFLFFTIILLFSSSVYSQDKFKLNSNDDTFKLREVGAYIIKDKDNFKVQFLAPEKFRLPEYKNVDLKKDDIILKINDRVVKKGTDLKETYDNIQPGNNIKLDVKRAGKMLTVNIIKAASKDLPQKKVLNLSDNKMVDKVLLPGYGVIIGKVNEKPMIEKIDVNNDLVKKAKLKGGDVLTNLNGKSIKTFTAFKSAYDNIKPGEVVNIRFGNKNISFKR